MMRGFCVLAVVIVLIGCQGEQKPIAKQANQAEEAEQLGASESIPAASLDVSESTPVEPESYSHRPGDLVGDWEITTKRGAIIPVTIKSAADGNYQVELRSNFGGLYEVIDNKFAIKEPYNDKVEVLVWEIESADSMTVIEAPTIRDIGSDYTGTKLTRTAK